MLRRDNWYELSDTRCVLAINKWTEDRESLVTALKETGWFFTIGAAMRAADSVVLMHTWSGIDADGALVLCEEDGDGGTLLEITPITIADVEDLID